LAAGGTVTPIAKDKGVMVLTVRCKISGRAKGAQIAEAICVTLLTVRCIAMLGGINIEPFDLAQIDFLSRLP
jgi:hypothetical protein